MTTYRVKLKKDSKETTVQGTHFAEEGDNIRVYNDKAVVASFNKKEIDYLQADRPPASGAT